MKLTQNQMILMHLQDYGSITSIEAMQQYGIMRLASRINDLKREGYNIVSETMKSKKQIWRDRSLLGLPPQRRKGELKWHL